MKKTLLISGLHSVRTALQHGAASVLEIWVEERRSDRRMREILSLAADRGVSVQQMSRHKMDALIPGISHQGVVARTRAPAAKGEDALREVLERLEQPPLLLILDSVQDPHNLGACLRTADAAGVDAVIAPKDRSTGLTPTACKVASGAAESVPFVQVTNLARTLRWLREDRGVWLIGTADDAESGIFATDLSGPVGIIMGGEERGLRRLTRDGCDLLVHLPMLGSVESLNVSVAAGICLYEAVRQRAEPG